MLLDNVKIDPEKYYKENELHMLRSMIVDPSGYSNYIIQQSLQNVNHTLDNIMKFRR